MTDGPRYRAGIDIGGTFTDVILSGDDGSLYPKKVLSTPGDYGLGIANGLSAALADAGAAPGAVEKIVHGTTVATNAILEAKGAKTGLITTAGFRDVLELRRLRIPEMYTLNYAKPPPLVPRRWRREVRERTAAAGNVTRELHEDDAVEACRFLQTEGVDAVAVVLLNSYANPHNEQGVAHIARAILGPGVFVTASHEILPVIREYERTSTTVINAYLGPIVADYFASVTRHLDRIGVTAPLLVMKSDGGVMSAKLAAERPAYIVESGPAAGVMGAAVFGAGRAAPDVEIEPDVLTLDMGGTTAKASIVEGGRVARTGDYEVGAGINLSSKLVMGGGYALKLPVIDISEIGAGGGSLVSIDAGGLLKVGPQSAGADPGPVAYGLGGEDPTFTDAVVTLGYLNPDHLVGGGLALDAPAAADALNGRIAAPLEKDLLDSAHGVFQVACGTMVRAVKAVSTYRGRDPRDFTLYAFGGNGPVVAAEIARLLEMTKVAIPRHPGVFSALGLLVSPVELEVARAHFVRLDQSDVQTFDDAFRSLESELVAGMSAEGYGPEEFVATRYADLRYGGQAHELTVDVPDPLDLADMAKRFGDEHERTYGHQAEAEAVECVTLRVIGRVPLANAAAMASAAEQSEDTPMVDRRRAFFGGDAGLVDIPVLGRTQLAAAPIPGPLIVEEYDSTIVVPPGWDASLDAAGTVHLAWNSRQRETAPA